MSVNRTPAPAPAAVPRPQPLERRLANAADEIRRLLLKAGK